MNQQQQPYHLYLLNQKPRKSILKTTASQVGAPKASKTATFFKEEQRKEPITTLQTKTLSFGANNSSPPQQEQQSESSNMSKSIGFSSQTPALNENISSGSVSQYSLASTQQLAPSKTIDSSPTTFFYKPSPSLLFQSLISDLPLKPDDVSNQTISNKPLDSLSSLMETNNGQSLSSNNNMNHHLTFNTQYSNTTLQNDCNNNTDSTCQPLVFQRMNTVSSLLSLFPSIQKETQDTKMSQQQVGRHVAPSSSATTSSDNLSHHSLINGGVVGLSNQSNMFKKDYSKAIRQFQNQTTNQFIQRTIASNLDNIQKNRPNIASDRSFLEGMELGMQLNGFLNKLTRDSKDYIKELLDDVSRRTAQVPPTTIVHNISSPTMPIIPTTTTSPMPVTSPTIDPFVHSSVQNIMQKGQEQAFQTLFVRKCMQEAVSRAIHNSQH
ncbi:predicted protein [Naegleria gruberi]|uniref:Predicted protein n=1 Tax=Naegleria gruberi TaxID=5762 RepID=D2V0U6_NAEGR|nr:uncharacterized protein NAEGRDRAFT_45782 [Naegleria gruberi]EFC49574.1 predicted protein [Naegleria gruberi]|eukprot:XP_002682318.1 predicted protein [Naegleria gruberi strain NEG-M]